jgi:AbrB family looped-hinge helix DNA binding protein
MKIDTNGKITIPLDIQNKLGLRPDTEVQLEVVGDALQISKPQYSSRGTKLIAAIRGKATNCITTNEIMQLTREEP